VGSRTDSELCAPLDEKRWQGRKRHWDNTLQRTLVSRRLVSLVLNTEHSSPQNVVPSENLRRLRHALRRHSHFACIVRIGRSENRRQQRFQLVETLAEDVGAGATRIDKAAEPWCLGEKIIER